jgi:hypothetical protein
MAAKHPNEEPEKPKDIPELESDPTIIIDEQLDITEEEPGYKVLPRAESEEFQSLPTEAADDLLVMVPGHAPTDLVRSSDLSGDAMPTSEVDEGGAIDPDNLTDVDDLPEADVFVITDTLPTMEVSQLTGTEPIGTEAITGSTGGVGLLDAHPDFVGQGQSVTEALPEMETGGGLPEIQSIEDITALVDESEEVRMVAPTTGPEFSVDLGAGTGKKRRSWLIPLSIAASLTVAAVLYGPQAYQTLVVEKDFSWFAWATPGGNNSLPTVDPVSPPVVAGGATTEGPEVGTVPPDMTPAVDPIGVPPVPDTGEFGDWMRSALAVNLGAPPERP